MTREEEAALVQRAARGDESAFEALVLENQTKVYHLALRIMGNEADAADAAQEAFLKAYLSLSGFRGESRFSAWLFRLTNNVCIDMLRKKKRQETVPLQTEGDDGEELTLEVPDERFSPEAALEQSELRRAVNEALATLPEDVRQILTLRELGGLSYDEIAQELKLEQGTVKSRLNRARKKLCAALAPYGNFLSDAPSKTGKGV